MSGQDFSGKQVGRYFLTSLIGCGAAGSVYKGLDMTLEYSPIYAIKCVQKSSNLRRRRQQIAELNNHNAVACCPHIMMLWEDFEDDDHFFLVFPLCEMDMYRAIWKDKLYWRNDELIREVFINILDGVFACHKKGVFHRDLKPENIMCNRVGQKIKIGDFGLSSDRRICRDGGCGTANYMSPECLDEREPFYYGEATDIWALGVILFNMVTCRYPWEDARLTNKDYMAFVTRKDHLYRTSPISGTLSMLLEQIWHPTPRRRLSIPAIREAVLLMDTFYKPRRSSRLSREVVLLVADSQQTCVAPGGDVKKKDSSDDVLEVIQLRRLDVKPVQKRQTIP